MNLYLQLHDLPESDQPIALAIGQFDGLHLGHQKVLQAAIASGNQPWVLTFHPHVAEVLNPAKAPLRLMTSAQQEAEFEKHGIHSLLRLPFTHEWAQQEHDAFIALLKHHLPGLRTILVGDNFTYGKNREGYAATLPVDTQQVGISAQIVSPLEWNGSPISSTRIRAATQEGRMADVRAMLGRDFSLTGTVVHGRQVGRTLDCRTANIFPHLAIRPKAGVYVASLHIQGVPHGGVAFVPDPADPLQTVFGKVVEIHLLNWNTDLYGQSVEIEFHAYLRAFQPFDSPEKLKQQLQADIAQTRQFFNHP